MIIQTMLLYELNGKGIRFQKSIVYFFQVAQC